MTHRTNAPPNEEQKVMHAMLSRPGKWWKASQIQDEFNLNEGTIKSSLSKFKNRLGFVEHDRPYYRIPSNRQYEAWVFIQYGWDGFETKVRDNVDFPLVNPPKIKKEDNSEQGVFDNYKRK